MNDSTPIKPVAYQYGVLLAIFSVLVLVLIYVLNIEQGNWMLSVVNVIATIAIFVFAIKEYKKKNSGFLSIKEAIKVGLAVAAVGGILTAIYSYIHYTYVNPEFLEALYDQAVVDMAGIPEDQRESALGIADFTTSPLFVATISLITSLFFGFIISLVAGAIMKQKRPYEV